MPAVTIKKAIHTCCPSVLKPTLAKVEASEIGSRLARGAFWSMAGAVISRGLMLIAYVCVARILGRELFGAFGIIRATVNMFIVFAGFGLGMTATKYVAQFREADPQRAGRIIGLSSLFAIITGTASAGLLIIFALPIARTALNAPELAPLLRIGSCALFINALNGAQTGALAGFEAFKTIAWVNAVVGMTSFPVLLAGAYLYGLPGAVWGIAIGMAINWVLNHLALRKETVRFGVPFVIGGCLREHAILWRFSLPAVLGGAMVAPVKWVVDAFLVNQANGYAHMGIFSAGLAIQNLILFTGSMVNAPLLSMLSNTCGNTNGRMAATNILVSWLLGLVIAVPLLCFPAAIEAMFGQEYAGQHFRLTYSLLLLSTCIVMYKQGLARLLAANDLMWWGMLSNMIWAAMLIGSAHWLVRYGATGLAVSYVLAYLLNTLVVVPIYYVKRLVPRSTLISPASAIIWGGLFTLGALNAIRVPVMLRLVISVFIVLIVAAAACTLIRHVGGLRWER